MARRYFSEDSEIKPGVISEELRNALGISKKALPIWIHRMRVLGYPPGWLKKADMTNTTMNFIDGDDGAEEGLIDCTEKKTYNTDSFYEYPGFNVPVPFGINDDYEKLGMPPMQEFQQLNYAKQTIQAVQPVPHRQRFTEVKDKDDDSENSSDEEDGEVLSDSEKKVNEKLTTSTSTSIEESAIDDKKGLNSTIDLDFEVSKINQEDNELSNDSQEIITLDIEKRVLCSTTQKKSVSSAPSIQSSSVSQSSNQQSSHNASLNQTASSDLPSLNDSCEIIESKIIIEQNDTVEVSEEHQSDQIAGIDSNQDDHRSNACTSEEIAPKVTFVSIGAPVPASLNGEKPPLENFAVGMGDLVYFENLPTSTGVFDKMRKVIKKVRKTLSASSSELNVSTSSMQTD